MSRVFCSMNSREVGERKQIKSDEKKIYKSFVEHLVFFYLFVLAQFRFVLNPLD